MMPSERPAVLRREQLQTLEKPELVDLLVLSLEAQEMTTRNMRQMNDLLETADSKIRELEGVVKSQAAEIVLLRNRA